MRGRGKKSLKQKYEMRVQVKLKTNWVLEVNTP